MVPAAETASLVVVGAIPKRGASWWNRSASSRSHP
jgi:hypothetical protein